MYQTIDTVKLKNIIETIDKLIIDINEFNKPQHFFDALINLVKLTDDLNEPERYYLAKSTKAYIDIINAVLINKLTINSLRLIIISSEKVFNEEKVIGSSGIEIYKKRAILNVEEKEFLYIALILSAYLITLISSSLTKLNILYIRKRLTNVLKYISHLPEVNLDLNLIYFRLAEILQSHRYLSIDKFNEAGISKQISKNITLSKCLMGSMLTVIPLQNVLSERTKTIFESNNKDVRIKITFALDKIYSVIYKFDKSLEKFKKQYVKELGEIKKIEKFIQYFQSQSERNMLYFLGEMTKGFKYHKEGVRFEDITDKISSAQQISEQFQNYISQHLLPYYKIMDENDEGEWSNKIYITSCRTLAVLASVNKAVDKQWGINVAIYEYALWLRNIYQIINKYHFDNENKDYLQIIREGENNVVEFKASLRWDLQLSCVNKKLEYVIAKTISAFLNSEGGTLFIGLSDTGDVLGIDKDTETVKNANKDGFLLQLTQVINLYIGKEFNQYLNIKFVKLYKKNVCVVEIEASDMPVYLHTDNIEEFYVRASATSQPLNVRETHEYIKTHWN